MAPELHSHLPGLNFTIKVKVNQRSIAGSSVGALPPRLDPAAFASAK